MSLPPKLLRNLVLAVIASIVFYGVWVVLAGPGDVWDELRSLGFAGWAAILGLSLFNYALRFGRWDFYLRKLGHPVPLAQNLRFYLAGFAFTATPGKVGEAVRSVYLKRFNVRYVDSFAAFFVERLVDLVAMVLLAVLAVFVFESWRWLVITVMLVVIACLPLVHSERVLLFLDRLRTRFSSERLQDLGAHLLSMLRASAVLLKTGNLYIGLLIGVVAWAAEGVALYVVVTALGVEISLALAIGIYGVSILAGVASLVPGGLGGTEVVMGALLVLSGVPEAVAVSSVIICRIATLWFAVAIGVLATLDVEVGSARPTAAGKREA